MVSKVKVSVIIPVYNASMYLAKCLDSLVNQTLSDIEIICVNDGSSDNSLDILNEYAKKDSRIKIINQKNQGQSVARNLGIINANGEYIGFLDSDDWAYETMFEHLYNNAKIYNSDMTMCSISIYDDPSGQILSNDPYMTLSVFPKDFFNKSFNYNDCLNFIFRICVTPWNKIYKKEWVDNNKLSFYEGVNFEDTIFSILTLIKAKKISLLDEPLVFYRKSSQTSYSQGNHTMDYKKLDFFVVFEQIEKILKDNNIYVILKEYFDFHKKNTLIYWYKKIQNRKVKKQYYKKLSNLYPDFRFNKINLFIKKLKLKNTIKKLSKNRTLIIWGYNNLTKSVIPKSCPNILGYIDTNPDLQGKIAADYKVYAIEDLKNLNPSCILAITQYYYKFGDFVQNKIKDNGLDIAVVEFTI